MLRSIAILIAALGLAGSSAGSESFQPEAAPTSQVERFHHETPARSPAFLESLGLGQTTASPTQQACCKICSRGKACGDTCISRDKTCHVGPGCACDG